MPELNLVQIEDVEGVTLVRLKTSHLLKDEQVEAFGDALEGLAEQPGRRTVLSFLGVEHLTSQALGRLIHARECFAKSGGELRLADIDPRIYEVFSITRLDKLFRIFEREEDAIGSFTSGKAEA